MSGRSKDISAAYGGVAVTPSDATVIPTTRALWVGSIAGGAGLAVRFANGDLVTFAGLTAGREYPFQVDKVLSTGTTASDIVALY